MSTAAEQARARIEAIRQRNAATEAAAVEEAEVGEKRTPSGPIRHTVDLPRHRHRQWALWRFEVAGELGMSSLSGQRAFEALMATLLTDETVSRRVIAKLKSGDY